MPALLNIGVVTGLLPTKGLVLPLIAYGGTAMIVHISVIGVLFKLSSMPAQEVSYGTTQRKKYRRAQARYAL